MSWPHMRSCRNALHWWGESGENAIFVSSSATEKAPALWSWFERAVNASVDVTSAPHAMTRTYAGVSHRSAQDDLSRHA